MKSIKNNSNINSKNNNLSVSWLFLWKSKNIIVVAKAWIASERHKQLKPLHTLYIYIHVFTSIIYYLSIYMRCVQYIDVHKHKPKYSGHAHTRAHSGETHNPISQWHESSLFFRIHEPMHAMASSPFALCFYVYNNNNNTKLLIAFSSRNHIHSFEEWNQQTSDSLLANIHNHATVVCMCTCMY